jgi:hypothetical protein
VDYLSAKVTDPSLPDTTATIQVEWDSYLKSPRDTSLGNGVKAPQVQFYPYSPPIGLTVTGGQIVTIHITDPPPGGERQEQPADKPDLGAFPNVLSFGGIFSLPAAQPVQISYKGPKTDLSYSLSAAGADKFDVSVAGGFPYPLIGDGGGPSVTVGVKSPSFKGGATLVLSTKPTATSLGLVAKVNLIAN